MEPPARSSGVPSLQFYTISKIALPSILRTLRYRVQQSASAPAPVCAPHFPGKAPTTTDASEGFKARSQLPAPPPPFLKHYHTLLTGVNKKCQGRTWNTAKIFIIWNRRLVEVWKLAFQHTSPAPLPPPPPLLPPSPPTPTPHHGKNPHLIHSC